MNAAWSMVTLIATGGGGHGDALTTTQVALLVAGIALVVVGALLAVFVPVLILPARRRRRLLASGAPSTAQVRAVRSRNIRVGTRIGMRLQLDVHAPDGRIVPATANELIDPFATPPPRPGDTLPVRVDPADPARVAVDWDRSPAR